MLGQGHGHGRLFAFFFPPRFPPVDSRHAQPEVDGLGGAAAQEAGLGVNAGHDLNLDNLGHFLTIPGIAEVSIGHALIADAGFMGLSNAVAAYAEIARAGS